jgi:hypothetical protein
MIGDLNGDEKMLMEYMSAISERCYGAGWLENVEYVIWDALTTGPRKFGHGHITEEDIQRLNQLSAKANSWIIFDDEQEEMAIGLEKWKKKFESESGKILEYYKTG